MKFIKDCEEDLVNLELMERIYIRDLGLDWKDRFLVVAARDTREFTLKRYRTEMAAKSFLKRIYDQYKTEINDSY